MDDTSLKNIEDEEPFPWRLLASLACSLVIVLAGMFWTYRIWQSTNHKFHELHHVQETVDGLQKRVNLREASVR